MKTHLRVLTTAFLLLPFAQGCGEQGGPTELTSEQGQLSAGRPNRGVPPAVSSPTPVSPQAQPTAEEEQGKATARRHDNFKKLLDAKGADYVLEGTITSARAELIENTSDAKGGRWLVATRYQVAGRAWNRGGQGGEFWVMGGVLPDDVPPSDQYPRGQRYSHEKYPDVGDRVIVAVKERPLFGAGTVPRVAWNSTGIVTLHGKDEIPADAAAKLKSTINDAFAK